MVVGELVRTGTMFKSFPVTVLIMHGLRVAAAPNPWGTKYGRLWYGAGAGDRT